MIELNLLRYKDLLRVQRVGDKTMLWDPVRRKWLRSTPEEMVRQLILCHLISQCKYPIKLIQVEKELELYRLKKRFDILLYNRDLRPFMLVECKRPEIKLSQDTFDQVARYNLSLQVPYLLITNGKATYCSKINYHEKSYEFLTSLPPQIQA